MVLGLFVYGTPNPNIAPAEIRDAVAQLRRIGPASIRGEARNLGEYPAWLPRSRRRVVTGTVFALPDNTAILNALDAYEGYDPHAPETSLFLRRQRVVTLSDGEKRRAWVYVYNRELPAAG